MRIRGSAHNLYTNSAKPALGTILGTVDARSKERRSVNLSREARALQRLRVNPWGAYWIIHKAPHLQAEMTAAIITHHDMKSIFLAILSAKA